MFVGVDEKRVEQLDQLQRHLQRRGHHRHVQQQEPQRNDHVQVRHVLLQVPARRLAVQRDPERGKHHH